jgi:sugar lactone lactonase YvrE
MANFARSLSILVVAATLTACSSAGSPPLETPSAPLVTNAVRNDGGEGRLVLRIRVPRKKKTRRLRPHYISPATQAITISITGPTEIKKTAALTPNASGCSHGSCTVTIPGLKPCPSAANCYAATIETYDVVTGCPTACAIPPTAHRLSGNQSVAFRIAKARDNLIYITLDGVPASVVLVPAADATLSGNMASGFTLGKCNSPAQQVSVFALDADGNYILGVGAPTPSLLSNDAADLAVTATPPPASPNRFTLTPPLKAAANKVVQLTIGATPPAGSGGTPVTTHVNVTFGDLCGLYVSDAGNNAAKEILPVGGIIPASPAILTFATGISSPFGIAVDRFGNVYICDFFNNAVDEIAAVGGRIPASPTIRTLSSGFNRPEGVAVDGSGNVYVADSQNNAVEEILAVGGSIPASPTIKNLGSGFSTPSNVAVDASNNVYVADTGNKEVKEMLAVHGSIPASPTINTLGSAFGSGPTGVAVDAFGNVYEAERDGGVVEEIAAVDGTIPPLPTITMLGSGFGEPVTVAVDGSGNVYVVDYPSAIKEIVAVDGSIPASPTINTLGSGFLEPLGVAIR